MRTRFKRYIAIILLLLLQIVGSFDLYAAVCLPSPPSSTVKSLHLSKPNKSQTSYQHTHIDFRKNLSEFIADSDTDGDHKLFSAKCPVVFLIQFLYDSFGLQDNLATTFGFVRQNGIYLLDKYILFSNFRI
jgi:hypothetical protein